jgi:hypothetical protein
MDAETVPQTSTTVRQSLVRYRWTIALGLVSVVAALVAYHRSSMPLAATSVASVLQASDTNPAQQGVLGYLRAHLAIAEARPRDPAQQGVMEYLRAHNQ